MHLKIVFYFLHIVLSGMISGLSLAIMGTLFFENVREPLPLFACAFAVSTAWFIWRIRVQRKFKFSITQKAFKLFFPISLIMVAALTLGAKELLEVMMVNPPKIKYLLYITGAMAGMAISAQILDFERMPRREKITYKRGGERKDSTSWKRSSGSRLFQG
ncbi:MAG: hypothetical protein ACPGN3_11935 [Opitutales bacterium]